jgi:hypothetical protein
VKDSAFLGVRLADGLKLETSALGLRTKVWILGLRLLLVYLSSSSVCCVSQLPPTPNPCSFPLLGLRELAVAGANFHGRLKV